MLLRCQPFDTEEPVDRVLRAEPVRRLQEADNVRKAHEQIVSQGPTLNLDIPFLLIHINLFIGCWVNCHATRFFIEVG